MDQRSILVAYGSQSGNAQDLAEEIGEVLQRLQYITRVIEMNSCEPYELHRYSFVLLVCSTTGQGAFPDNARDFWKQLIRRKIGVSTFESVLCGIVGLGDSSYPQFNWAARKLERRLSQLGARSILPICELDESSVNGTDTILVSWLDILQERLQEFFGPSRDQPTFSDDAFLYPSWSLALLEPHPDPELSQPTNTASHVPGRLGRASLNGAKDITVQVAENHRLTPPSHFQEVRSVRLVGRELSNCRPGDAVGMFPRNAELDVHALLVLLKAEAVADCPLKIVSLTSRAEDIPKSLIQHAGLLTLRSIAANQLDLNSVPRRSFIRRISYFASEPAERERLRELSSSEFIEEYYDYVTRPRRTTLELLQDFSSVTIPWSYAASIIPLMHVRWFSISRSMALDAPNQRGSVQQSAVVPAVELLIATVDYQTVIRKRRKGVCTNYIATVKPGTSLRVLYQQGSIITSLSDHTRSAIMIGTGTGIAPLRSLLWERRTFGTDSEARVLLFFGGRNIRADYFFCDEWDDLAKDLHLQVFPTFSRDQRQKHYVQDKLHEESALLWEIINEEQGIVYVCGSSGKMPAAVRQTLVDVFQKEGKMSSEKANAYILAMIQANRYKQETW